MINIQEVTQYFKKPNHSCVSSFLRLFCINQPNGYDDGGHIVYCQMNCHHLNLETKIYLIFESCENLLDSSPIFLDFYRFKEGYPAKLERYLNEAIYEIQIESCPTNNHHLLEYILKNQLDNFNEIGKIYTFELNRENFLDSILNQIPKPIDELSKLIFWIDKSENIHFLWLRENR